MMQIIAYKHFSKVLALEIWLEFSFTQECKEFKKCKNGSDIKYERNENNKFNRLK